MSSRSQRHAALTDAERARVSVLRSYEVLDTPIETVYEDIVALARYITKMPIALVSLVEHQRQWFKAESGLGSRETPIEMSVCAHAMRHDGVFEIPDLASDPRFASNPLVTAQDGIRFYAGAPLVSPEGYPLGSLCVIDRQPNHLDDTQRALLMGLARQAMAHLELRRIAKASQAASIAHARHLAVAGHDLKQPLQVVNMVLSAQRLKAVSDTDRSRFDIAEAALRNLSDQLDELAISSTAAIDSDSPNFEVVGANEVLDMIAGRWREHADAKGIDLRVVASTAKIHTDTAMLATIITNLVGNAIKYTEQGRVLVGCRRRPDGLEIQIIDTGIGIAPDKQAMIFRPLRQLNETSDGLGLGLSIVRQTAEALGVPIAVSSVEGKGARFSVTVPTVSQPKSAMKPTATV